MIGQVAKKGACVVNSEGDVNLSCNSSLLFRVPEDTIEGDSFDTGALSLPWEPSGFSNRFT